MGFEFLYKELVLLEPILEKWGPKKEEKQRRRYGDIKRWRQSTAGQSLLQDNCRQTGDYCEVGKQVERLVQRRQIKKI